MTERKFSVSIVGGASSFSPRWLTTVAVFSLDVCTQSYSGRSVQYCSELGAVPTTGWQSWSNELHRLGAVMLDKGYRRYKSAEVRSENEKRETFRNALERTKEVIWGAKSSPGERIKGPTSQILSESPSKKILAKRGEVKPAEAFFYESGVFNEVSGSFTSSFLPTSK